MVCLGGCDDVVQILCSALAEPEGENTDVDRASSCVTSVFGMLHSHLTGFRLRSPDHPQIRNLCQLRRTLLGLDFGVRKSVDRGSHCVLLPAHER